MMSSSKLFRIGAIAKTTSKAYFNQQNYSQICGTLQRIHVEKEREIRRNYVRSISTSTVETQSGQTEEGLIKKILKKIPFLNVEKTKIRANGYLLYEGIADRINYIEIFEELNLPDTFYSWFVVTELHIWMLSVRVMADGDVGKLLRNAVLEAFWDDVHQRSKKLEAHNPAAVRSQISELSEQLMAAMLSYDEGLHSDDIVLAGAFWRRFYQQEDADPQCLEQLVKYVRKTIRLLDKVPAEQLRKNKAIIWDSFRKVQ